MFRGSGGSVIAAEGAGTHRPVQVLAGRGTLHGDTLEGVFQASLDVDPRPLDVGSGAARAAAEPKGAGQLGGQLLDFLARGFRAGEIMMALGFLELRAQRFEAAPVFAATALVEHFAAIAGIERLVRDGWRP